MRTEQHPQARRIACLQLRRRVPGIVEFRWIGSDSREPLRLLRPAMNSRCNPHLQAGS